MSGLCVAGRATMGVEMNDVSCEGCGHYTHPKNIHHGLCIWCANAEPRTVTCHDCFGGDYPCPDPINCCGDRHWCDTCEGRGEVVLNGWYLDVVEARLERAREGAV